MSALVHAEITEDGVERRLTEDEVVSFAMLLYSAGTETVAKLLGNAAVLLAAHPDQRADLVADPSLLPDAVEELLRIEPPSPVQRPLDAEADIEWHGTTIPEGSKVLLLTGSAPAATSGCSPTPTASTSGARSRCTCRSATASTSASAPSLARLESRIGLEETLMRFPEWTVEPGAAVRVHTSTVRGYSSVPIRL